MREPSIIMFAFAAFVLNAPIVEAQNSEVANAMTTVKCSASAWTRYCERAFALHIGVPEQRLKAAVPGFNWPDLPKAIEPLMSGDPAALEQLAALLKDTRATQVKNERTLISPDEKPYLAVADLADSLIAWLVPLGSVSTEDKAQASVLMEKQIQSWSKQLSKLKPEERLAAWLGDAAPEQRRMALAFFIATDHTPAWPLIEQSLLQRAKDENELGLVVLETAAYVRHRRHEAAAFLKRLRSAIKAEELSDILDAVLVVRNGESMLTEPSTAEQRVQQFLNGTLTLDELSEWAVRGIDQPWAYHSLGIEAASVHVRPMRRCVVAAITGAASTNDLSKRLQLLQLASNFANTLNDIMANAHEDELPTPPGPRDESFAAMTAALKTLLKDKRESFDRGQLTGPAVVAAECVWEMWGTNTRQLDSVFHGVTPDWRGLAAGFPRDHAQLLIKAAADVLDDKQPMKPEPFPEKEARKLFAELKAASPDEWPTRFKNMIWQQKLMLSELAHQDDAVARTVWPRMQHWKTLSDANPLPESFLQIWKTACEGKTLGDASFTALKDWIMTEAVAGRFWAIVAESSAYSDGLTLHLCAQKGVKMNAQFRLRTTLEGTEVFMMLEDLQYSGKKWSKVKMQYQSNRPAISTVIARLNEHIPVNDEKKARVRVLVLTLVCENHEQ